MEAFIILGVVNCVYAIIALLVMKFRNSKDHDWRLLDQDYEYVETLGKTKQEQFWTCMNPEIKRLMLLVWGVMNLSLLTCFSFDVWSMLVVLLIGLCMSVILYIKAVKDIKKNVNESQELQTYDYM